MTDVRAGDGWPELRVDDWEPTRRSLHMWTQIVGKVRLAHAPLINHWWQVPLYVSPRGLTTSAIPLGTNSFDMEFDFVDHALAVRVSDGGARRHRSAGYLRGAVPPRSAGRAQRSGHRGGRLERTQRSRPCHPVRRGHARRLRPRRGQRVLATAGASRPGARPVPCPVHRQGQSRALLLGLFRFGVHPILRSPRAPASRRCAELRRLGHGGGLLTRAQQLRVLARRRGRRGLLLLRISRTGRVSPTPQALPPVSSTTPGCGSTCCRTSSHARRRTQTGR